MYVLRAVKMDFDETWLVDIQSLEPSPEMGPPVQRGKRFYRKFDTE